MRTRPASGTPRGSFCAANCKSPVSSARRTTPTSRGGWQAPLVAAGMPYHVCCAAGDPPPRRPAVCLDGMGRLATTPTPSSLRLSLMLPAILSAATASSPACRAASSPAMPSPSFPALLFLPPARNKAVRAGGTAETPRGRALVVAAHSPGPAASSCPPRWNCAAPGREPATFSPPSSPSSHSCSIPTAPSSLPPSPFTDSSPPGANGDSGSSPPSDSPSRRPTNGSSRSSITSGSRPHHLYQNYPLKTFDWSWAHFREYVRLPRRPRLPRSRPRQRLQARPDDASTRGGLHQVRTTG